MHWGVFSVALVNWKRSDIQDSFCNVPSQTSAATPHLLGHWKRVNTDPRGSCIMRASSHPPSFQYLKGSAPRNLARHRPSALGEAVVGVPWSRLMVSTRFPSHRLAPCSYPPLASSLSFSSLFLAVPNSLFPPRLHYVFRSTFLKFVVVKYT